MENEKQTQILPLNEPYHLETSRKNENPPSSVEQLFIDPRWLLKSSDLGPKNTCGAESIVNPLTDIDWTTVESQDFTQQDLDPSIQYQDILDFNALFPGYICCQSCEATSQQSDRFKSLENETQGLKEIVDDQNYRIRTLETFMNKQESYIISLHEWATSTEKLNIEFRQIVQELHGLLYNPGHLQNVLRKSSFSESYRENNHDKDSISKTRLSG